MKALLKKPENHAQLLLLTKQQMFFIQSTDKKAFDENLDYLNLTRNGADLSKPRQICFEWEMNEVQEGNIFFEISEYPSFAKLKRVLCQGNSTVMTNFLIGRQYFWRIAAFVDGIITPISETFTFITEYATPRWIDAEGISNVRDLGGYRTESGKRIKQGLVYRGGEMEFHQAITEKGKAVLLDELQIRTDLDLRREALGRINCSALGERVKWVLIPTSAYAEFLRDKETCKQIFQLFTKKSNYPIYFHCWGGADRTGTIAFLLGGLLGMSEDDLMMEYELTSLSVWGGRSRHSEWFRSFITELNGYGSENDSVQTKCETYLLSTGLTQDQLQKIRTLLLEHLS